MSYSIEHINTIVKGQLQVHAGSNVVIEHLLLDSRKVIFPATSLFFALPGERRSGYSFLPEAYAKGVRHFVVSEPIVPADFPDASVIVVKNTLQALQALAAYHRKQFTLPVIGITGSNGKTIVKEWLNQLLEPDYNIVRSPKSYNSQVGVPLSVWQITARHELGIFEAGISQSGEMEKLERIIQPTIGVFTNIGEAHSQGFVSERQKMNEKLQLFRQVETLVYCKDYPSINEGIAAYIQQFRDAENRLGIQFFSWSMKADATLLVTSILKDASAAYITAEYNGGELSLKIPFTDDASVENAITCWCVLLKMNMPAHVIEQRMLQLTTVAMRLELKKGINNCSIINDSYSADVSSLKIALDFLVQQQQHARKTVILSDILQSGKSEGALYETVAQSLQEKGIDRLIGIGENISRHQKAFQVVPGLKSSFYATVDLFRKDFYHLTFSNETILLKGARVFAFEEISRLLEQKVHQTVLEINLNAIASNVKLYQQLLRPATRLMAMVKAFSYGSGSYEIANLLQFHKVDYLAVAYADEGVELRKAGISLPIMVMNPEESTYDAIVQFGLEPDIFSLQELHSFDIFIKQQGLSRFPVHIEIETGMNRLGFSQADLPQLIDTLQQSPLHVQSVFSHLAAAEDPQHDQFTQQQGALLLAACSQLQAALGYPFIRHIANTAGIMRHPQWQLDMVRLGIGLYGFDSTASGQLPLQEVSTLKTTIAQIKHLAENETVGYGRKGVLTGPGTIATVRLGYADGYSRKLGHGAGKMLIKGKLAPIIGTICMDMTMIDITGIDGVQEGDEVIVFGAGLSIREVAHWAHTIPYEIMTSISQRVKRVYFEES